MTETKSDTLSTIKSLLLGILTKLNESYFQRPELEPIDNQCHARFGKTWNEVKAQMLQTMSNITFAGEDKIHPEIAVKGIGLAGGTSNWMTNKYLGVLYLYFLRAHLARVAVEIGKPYNGIPDDPEFKGVVEAIESGAETEFLNEATPLYWSLLHIASWVLPEEVEKVLMSHGL